MSERLCEGCDSVLPPMRYQGNPRKWCSRSCEQRTKRERTGLPTSRTLGERSCDHCEAPFSAVRSNQRFCSPDCGWRHRQAQKPHGPGKRQPRHVDCYECGAPAGETVAPRRLCDDCRYGSRSATNRRKNAKRRGIAVAVRYTLNEIADRDGWRCHLCSKAVDRRLPGTAKFGPTIDHLVPVAAGGDDTPQNVALAHRHCNVTRQDKGVAQLRLTG